MLRAPSMLAGLTRLQRGAQLKSLARAFSSNNEISAASVELKNFIDNYRRFGHLEAAFNPLGHTAVGAVPELELSNYPALSAAGEDVSFAGATGPIAIQSVLRQYYCGTMAAEFSHLDSAEEREWFASRFEALQGQVMRQNVTTPAEKRNINVLLQMASCFEEFLEKKFVGFKRYSGEGTEGMLTALDAIFGTAAKGDVDDVVVGMPHRGRLSFLVTLMQYPARKLLRKIQGKPDFPESVQGLDDVSSHVACSVDRSYSGAKKPVHVSLLHNPSHLEAVNPVATGKTRAKRDAGSNAMCVLLHGDAAFAGQGVVPETFMLSRLEGYSVAGTVHIIVNNQVGFTAESTTGRSSRYASDIGKIVHCPVLHVNAEDVEATVAAARLATEYRNRYGKDVIIDLIGYRKHGHNELDDPTYTNPVLYSKIKGRQGFPSIYANKLKEAGLLSDKGLKELKESLTKHLESEFEASKQFTNETGSGPLEEWAFQGNWNGMRQSTEEDLSSDANLATGVPVEDLKSIGRESIRIPEGFSRHVRLEKWAESRVKLLEDGVVDWPTAEALGFGSLLKEGNSVRMSGQDSMRGTFSQRHYSFFDQESGSRFSPFKDLAAAHKSHIDIFSSNLSEFAVLGFEYGYSLETPRLLPLWEAQFGDFANGAQIIIDNFITSSESKWLRQTGLVMLLPHGYDGAGPEHSTGRPERFLQLVNTQAWARGAACLDPKQNRDKVLAETCNLIVANLTTPANYFHFLRRQVARPFRKPAVIMAPKTLLRDARARSSIEDLGEGTHFHPVYNDAAAVENADKIKRVFLCSGKIYYDLVKRRQEVEGDQPTTAVIRIEELAPFPSKAVASALATFSKAKDVAWVQEEPANGGAWSYAEAHLAPIIKDWKSRAHLEYIGKPALSATAVGVGSHDRTQAEYVLNYCFPQ